MGACVVVKSKNLKQNGFQNNNEALKDLETLQVEINDKKTARALDKQSQEVMKKYLEAESISHEVLFFETTKQSESQINEQKKKTNKISLKSMSSFCQSVQRQFEVFQSFSQYEKQHSQIQAQNKANGKSENQVETSQIEREEGISLNQAAQLTMNQAPSFLRKYLPLQQHSIQIKYL